MKRESEAPSKLATSLRGIGVNVGLVLAGMLLSWGVFEIIIRIWDPHNRGAKYGLERVMKPHKTRWFTPRHGSESIVRGLAGPYSVSINTIGFRDKEYPVAKNRGRTRLVVLGDSFTFGNGVDVQARFTEVIEDSIFDMVDVINCGVNSYNTTQEEDVFNNDVLPLNPDAVLLLYCINDIEVMYGRAKNFPLHNFLRAYCYSCAFLYQQVRNLLVGLEIKQPPVMETAVAKPELGTVYDRVPTPRFAALWRQSFSSLMRIAALAKEKGIWFGIALIPFRQQVEPDEWYANVDTLDGDHVANMPQRLMHDFTTSNDIPFLNLRPPLRAAFSQGKNIHLSDGHWNITGHRIVAEAIAAFLIRSRAVDSRFLSAQPVILNAT